ncbi:hypothetical protein L3C95_11660 [Chitinophaga filiformis]|uniref:hypothetical protein n=1 Tax=Chitinophaga filiformis TaxID=104663 RepID=UPI001F25C81F|nr:hypothetical protein [Chitinophaga filiformis]MCF6402546.1 hypothetical protein [Chitinophaga filiformis]MCF6403536.1 hypothetical protein [Chitinophaga filiformis]
MNKGAIYRHVGITAILSIISLYSWGSTTLPQPTYKVIPPDAVRMDTIPVKKPVETETVEPTQELPVEPVIKEVPKAKKQVKPIAVPSVITPVKTPKIIKPKIVIKKIGVRVP